MRWLLFIPAAYLAAALSVGLGSFLSLGSGHARPDLLIVLLAFVTLQAPTATARVAALLLGILADTLHSHDPAVPGLLGPFAIGYLVGYFAIQQLRPFLVRDSVITLAVMSLAAAAFAHLTAATLLSLRGLPIFAGQPVPDFTVLSQLGRRTVQTLYTTALAFPVGFLLLRTKPLWRFPTVPRH
ncbi:MAG: hypothetical protein AAGI68_11360 [Planctomycetota bacterium]